VWHMKAATARSGRGPAWHCVWHMLVTCLQVLHTHVLQHVRAVPCLCHAMCCCAALGRDNVIQCPAQAYACAFAALQMCDLFVNASIFGWLPTIASLLFPVHVLTNPCARVVPACAMLLQLLPCCRCVTSL
jgi:hypothetical protein